MSSSRTRQEHKLEFLHHLELVPSGSDNKSSHRVKSFQIKDQSKWVALTNNLFCIPVIVLRRNKYVDKRIKKGQYRFRLKTLFKK